MSEQIIELGLHQNTDLLTLMDRILAMLPDTVTESGELRSLDFREEIARYRELVRSQKPLAPIAHKMLDVCQDYFRRVKMHSLAREHEYVELIDVLRDAVSHLAVQSTKFNAQLVTSSDRFNKLLELDDIREIKNQISREVQFIRRAVEEKQKNEEQNLSVLSERVEVLQVKLNRATDEAATDALTRIANRGTFDKTIARWIEDNARDGGSFVMALADIDDFKKINDQHGHPVGDRVLMGAAQLLSGSVRPGDFVARYGGEEFVLLLSGIQIGDAEPRMEQLLKTIAAYRFEYEAGGSLQFTLSCGMAEFTAGDTAETLIQRTDEGLYEAKRKGKNRVISRKKSRLKSLFGK